MVPRPNSRQALTALAEPLSPGAVLRATYKIEHLIAVGGMGAVYEARHMRLGRRVAIKVLVGDGDWSSGLVTRLRQEAEIVAHLEHPHIVQVVDVDETDEGVPYLVMEYLEGETLATRLEREGALSVVEALRITSDIASALAQVHARGIVHCDLKPGNIFLVRVDGEPDFVKVFDFGISRAPDPSDAPTSVVAGTLRYMPPEQSGGNPYLDARVDQFALAAVVYEMLSGQPAFAVRRPLQTLTELELEPAADISKVAPWVPSEFDAVLGQALSREREARFQSVSRFAWELTNAAIRAGVDREGESSGPGSGVHQRRLAELEGTADSERTARLDQDTRVETAAPWHQDIEQLLESAKSSFEANELDLAVEQAERVLDLALHEFEGRQLATLASRMPLLDEIFDARVRALGNAVRVRPISDPTNRRLSPRARQILALAETPTEVERILRDSGIPERDCTRLLASLLRRGILVAA